MAAQSLLVQDVRMTQLGWVRRPYGLSVTYLSLGGIEQRVGETAAADSNVGASDLSLSASYAKTIAGVGLGVTGKYIRESIAGYSASAYGLDCGALWRLKDFPLSLGAALTNLGPGLRFVEQRAPLPTALRVGAAYGLTPQFPHALVLQADFPRDAGPNLRLGLEYKGFGPITLRMGYRTYSSEQRKASLGTALGSAASGLSDFYGMSLGSGLRTPYGEIDFAMVPYGELGTAYRLSYSYNFGAARKTAKGNNGLK
jgi:hypothetical protein